jgi:hypothetical protein
LNKHLIPAPPGTTVDIVFLHTRLGLAGGEAFKNVEKAMIEVLHQIAEELKG